MKSIIQISPTIPPNIGGVGNYAKLLADFLKKKGISSKILVSDHLENKNKINSQFGKNKDLLFLLNKNSSKKIILHFSGYGYASRGHCFRLVESLNQWKKIDKRRKLITIFHEVYATGPIYRMSFWTSVPQKYLAKKLAKISDASIVTTRQNKMILSSFNSKKKIIYTNVFSNIGELNKNKALKDRKNTAIIFGNTYQKEILYKDILLNENKYKKVLKNFFIEKIIDIGPRVNISKEIRFMKISSIGIKSKKYISSLFKNSKIGFVFYPVSQMTKSGIVAAYVSHGLIVINFCDKNIFKSNEFVSGVNYISDVNSINDVKSQKIANEAYKNYQKYGLSKTTLLITRIIDNKN